MRLFALVGLLPNGLRLTVSHRGEGGYGRPSGRHRKKVIIDELDYLRGAARNVSRKLDRSERGVSGNGS